MSNPARNATVLSDPKWLSFWRDFAVTAVFDYFAVKSGRRMALWVLLLPLVLLFMMMMQMQCWNLPHI